MDSMFDVTQLSIEELRLKTGLTPDELEIVINVANVWNKITTLELSNASVNDAQIHIDSILKIIMHRVVSRQFPEFWNIP